MGVQIVPKQRVKALAFVMILWMLAIWSLVPLPFLNPAWPSGSSWFTYCWSLAWRILISSLSLRSSLSAAAFVQTFHIGYCDDLSISVLSPWQVILPITMTFLNYKFDFVTSLHTFLLSIPYCLPSQLITWSVGSFTVWPLPLASFLLPPPLS